MKISIVYSAQLRNAAGVDRESLELDGPQPLQDFTTLLAEKRGDPFKSAIMGTDNALRRCIVVCVNDEQIGTTETRVLSDGDEVAFLSPISGG